MATVYDYQNPGGAVKQIQDGQYTATVYGLIRDQKFDEVIRILTPEFQNNPKSRAALSLLGYSYYQLQDFVSAANMYEALVRNFPDLEEYKLAHAQALYKAGLYVEAMRASGQVDGEEYKERISKLQAYIKYEQGEQQGTRDLLMQCSEEDHESIITLGCIAFKEEKYDEARTKFQEAMSIVEFDAQLAHNIALCHYHQKQYGPALKQVGEIIERGIREHPELCIGSGTEGIDVRSVGNSQALRETALIEAFNLKAAIEYQMKKFDVCKEALSDMPPRSDDELDPVTLHNQALMNMEEEPAVGFRKLNHLLSSGGPFPPETFGNLLLLYVKYEQYDLAADILAENMDLHMSYLKQEVWEFLEAVLLQATSPEEAYRKYDDLASKHVDVLRKLTKQIQDARNNRNNEAIKGALKEYDEALERYIPILMGMAKIYWNMDHYAMVEKIFRQSAEFCSEHETWKLNVAHVFFMQDNKYKEAIQYYEPFVKKHWDNLLDVQAIILANLCVAYIMTSQNEQAEEVMRRLEQEEEQLGYEDPDKPIYHLCIVNLVIGTLYCAKGNFEFGISRVIKSLEPYSRKLGLDTWFYTKRCFLALAETLSKHMIMLKDSTMHEILTFLDAAELHGKGIKTKIAKTDRDIVSEEFHNVSTQARMLKRLFIKLHGV